MTKNFKELISEYKIIIPLIQRDYAQGREKETEKANNFLDAILKGTKEDLNIDFIYGKIDEEKNFIPLDGQQRLTTLLLIHWFVSLEDTYIETLQNFNYEVRSSTKDFIKKLMSESSWKSFKKSNLRASIENANWFFLSWKYDPTVVAILNILEFIETKFQNIKINDLNNITFEFLNLNDFDLTDELYVKMNARGKPLTEFENFKSNFEKFLLFEDKKYEHKTKAKLDNKWLNIFWKIAQEKVKKDNNLDISDAPKIADEMFYNFFYNITLNFYLENRDKLDCKINDEEKIFSTTEEFVKVCTIFNFYENVYILSTNIDRLISILDNLEINTEFNIFIVDKNISYWERARFYALALGYINKLDEIEFKKWKRISFNLINNQLIQSPENLIDTLKSLKKLSTFHQNGTMIYQYIKNNKDNISFFHEIQREEESLKAHLILENELWENEFINAESDWYLNGQVGFLLKYSQNDIEKFKEYRDKFIALWSFSKDNQILLYRALLTKGDYLIKLKSNYTFCSFNGKSVRNRNDNWRKVFNDDIKTNYFQALLDDIDTNAIKKSLETIIEQWLLDKSYCNEEKSQDKYLYTLISNKDNIKYCEQLQLRYYKNGTEVYLLKTKQMNGTHAELYTYNLYKQYFENKPILPFEKSEYLFTNSWEPPCIVLNDWGYKKYKFEIYIYFEDDKYEIYFAESNKKVLNLNLINILEQNDFKKQKKYQYILKTDYTLCKEKELVSFIKVFIKKLSTI